MKRQLIAQIPSLRAYALLLSRSATEADDLVQETLMRAWRFQDSFQPGTNLRAWLFRILRNAFLRSVGQPLQLVRDADDLILSRLAVDPDQEWRLRYKELLRAIDLLSSSARESLLLVAVSGLTYEEAAVVCGCSVGTVKSRVNRARAKLLKLMDGEGDREPAFSPRLATVV